MTDFERALAFVLRPGIEGGYVNNPVDPGGATNKGITQRVYDAWRSKKGLVPRSVEQIEDREVAAIYETGYWVPAGCPRQAWPLCLVQFDTAVNMGVQRALGFASSSEGDVDTYLRKRRAYYMNLASTKPNLQVFLRGWLNRVDALTKEIA